MKIETFALERWMTAWETKTPYDIAESGIFPMTAGELLAFEPREERERRFHLMRRSPSGTREGICAGHQLLLGSIEVHRQQLEEGLGVEGADSGRTETCESGRGIGEASPKPKENCRCGPWPDHVAGTQDEIARGNAEGLEAAI